MGRHREGLMRRDICCPYSPIQTQHRTCMACITATSAPIQLQWGYGRLIGHLLCAGWRQALFVRAL